MTIKEQIRNELKKELRKELARRTLLDFTTYTKPDYEINWHHKYLCEKLDLFAQGKIKKLMVFMPPQHGKSELVSRRLPAYLLGINPNLKIVGCSYSGDLSRNFNRDVQRIIDSEEYSKIFPKTYLSKSNIRSTTQGNFLRNTDEFEPVSFNGKYKAVGVGGALTGNPVDIGIIDDPIKDRVEANSPAYKRRLWDWYNEVFLTRLHNNSQILLTNTRWAEDDLAGKLLKIEKDEWVIVNFPAIKDVKDENDPRKIGEALWESKHSKERILKQKKNSIRTFEALYQQRPAPLEGDIIKKNWFEKIEWKNEFNRLVWNFIFDTAYTDKETNDPSGYISYAIYNNDFIIRMAETELLQFPDLCRRLQSFVYQNGYTSRSIIKVEPKASGLSVIQQLKRQTNLNITQTKPPKDGKEIRLRTNSPIIESGRIKLIVGNWNEQFINQICTFPNASHDEFVDCLNMMIEESLKQRKEIRYNM